MTEKTSPMRIFEEYKHDEETNQKKNKGIRHQKRSSSDEP